MIKSDYCVNIELENACFVPLSGGKQPVDKRGSLAVENNTEQSNFG